MEIQFVILSLCRFYINWKKKRGKNHNFTSSYMGDIFTFRI